jgi:NitT/TauT family transport system substrate-binding protein
MAHPNTQARFDGHPRRQWLAASAVAALTWPLTAPSLRAQPARTRLRMLLNTGFSSPQAWLWLARSRGYLEEQGIELDLTPGAGAYTAAPRMIDGNFDLAYGDVNALIEECARRPEAAPRGIYMMFNASPSCVAVAASGPLKHPHQLPGRRLVGHDTDVALRTFGALCLHHGIDPQAVQVNSAWSGMAGMVQDVLAGRTDGAFGYVSTFTGALTSADPALLPRVRFLNYAEFAPDLYGSVVMASPRLLRDRPDVVRRLLLAINRGVQDMLREPEAGLQALEIASPGFPRPAERARLQATLALEMNPALPAGAPRVALGDIDEARMARSLSLMARGQKLPRTPSVAEVFTRDFLPPAAQRQRPA